MPPSSIEIGRLLRAGTTGFVTGCSVTQFTMPTLGALVYVKPDENRDYRIYGLIYDIHIDDDGLVRQLVTADNVSHEVMRDNRERRIVPVEMSVLSVGYEQDGQIFHLLPPRPPLSLDAIYLCDDGDLVRFTGAGRFGYFRHILRAQDAPVGEILAAHVQQAGAAHQKAKPVSGNGETWKDAAAQELITLLRDDYPTLMSVLGALGEVLDNPRR